MRWLEGLLNLLFPLRPVCPLCGGKSAAAEVCPACLDALARYRRQPRCFCCGRVRRTPDAAGWPALRETAEGKFLCPECLPGRRHFSLARSAGPYEDGLKEAILRFKFGRKRYLAAPLGALLAEVVREIVSQAEERGSSGGGAGGVFAALVPVPLSRRRREERGFNQAELLAEEAAARTSLPVVPLLRKVRETPPQAGLSRAERMRNLGGAFAVSGAVPVPAGLCVILVDDVFTTGATADECARVLMAAGVGKVCVATLAGAV